MWIQKPNWISHHSDESDELPILCIDIDPTQQRFITGSIDNSVCVWRFQSLLDGGEEESLLSVLQEHQGPVNSLRWSPTALYFASASDDGVVLVWEFKGRGKKSLMSEEHAEDWRAVLMLRGHNADVREVAWSADGALLASGSVDNKILVWNVGGKQTAPVKCLEGHRGLVSGLVFDPVSKFLVSLGEDSSMIVWSMQDWRQIYNRGDVFRHSSSQPLKRISMSPDGFYVVTPGPKKSTFKFMASAFQRDKWEVDLYLVGHLQALSVARCSPVLYKTETTPTWCVALGSYDCGISIWRYGDQKPLVVRDLFEAAVADIAWSPDGSLLVACSSDGTIATLSFEGSLGQTLNRSEYMQYMMNHYGSFPFVAPTALPSAFVPKFETRPQTTPSPPVIQQEVRTESGKRRIQPQLVSAAPAIVVPQADPPPTAFQAASATLPPQQPQTVSQAASGLSRIMHSAHAPSVPELPATVDLAFEPKFTTVLHKAESKDFTSGVAPQGLLSARGLIDIEANLAISVQLYPGHYRNTYTAAKAKIRCTLGRQVVWEDLTQYTPVLISGNQQFSLIYTQEGYLSFYTAAGRKMFPEVLIGEIAYLETSPIRHAMVITRAGMLTCWNLEDRKVEYTTSVAHLLPSVPKPICTRHTAHAELNAEGIPILHLTGGDVHAYDRAMNVWMKVAAPAKRPLCESVPSDSKDVVRVTFTQSQLWNVLSIAGGEKTDAGDFMQLTLSDVESQLVRAEKLNYAAEYQYLLTRYVNMLLESREILKLKELIREMGMATQPGKKALLEKVVEPLVQRSPLRELLSVNSK